MDIEQIKATDLITGKWTGGTTTQLYIFPKNANYKTLNFAFRISTAKIETKKSDFTALPNVSRILMILDGNIEIEHKNHYKKQMSKFDIDTFEGGWKTSSIGKCVDFNLMTTNKTNGNISSLIIKKDKYKDYKIDENNKFLFIYLFKGETSAKINNKNYTLQAGDLLNLTNLEMKIISFEAIQESELVFCSINNI